MKTQTASFIRRLVVLAALTLGATFAAGTAQAAPRVTVSGTFCTAESNDVAFAIEALRALNTALHGEGTKVVATAHGTTRVSPSRMSVVGTPKLRTLPSGRPQACVAVRAQLSANDAVALAMAAAN